MIDYLKSLFSKSRCTHKYRCVHGDEINYLRGARSVCLKCGKPGEFLPFYCFYSKEIHDSYMKVLD
jgi:hypothetical protein